METQFRNDPELPDKYALNKVVFLIDNKTKDYDFLNEFQKTLFANIKKHQKSFQFYYLDTIDLNSKTLINLFLESRPNGIMICNTNGKVTIHDQTKISQFNTSYFISYKMDFYYLNLNTLEVKPHYTLHYFIANKIPANENNTAFNELENSILKYLFK
ncbi:MAG: hypothetical protein JXB49_03820 [Bacteroidales bacterium]|nr:hypothetical protein [Bacteroidales bacterium]